MRKSKNKILTLFISVALLICVFALSVFAEDTTTDSPTDSGRGANYDESHVENGCCTTVDSEGVSSNHYETGYDDGYTDGYADGKESQQSTIDSMQSTIDSLKGENSGEDNPDDSTGDGSSGGSDSGIGEGEEEPEEPTDEEAYINYWKNKYLETLELYDGMADIAAKYKITFDEANRRIEALGGETVTDPLDGDLGEVTFTIEDAEKQLAIDEYLQSDGYLDQQAEKQIIIISEYKGSDEYKEALNTQYLLGTSVATEEMYNTAYAEAYDAVYALGVAEGYSNYMGTKQYTSTIELAQSTAYEQGYLDGYDYGNENSTSTEYDLTPVISLMIGFVGLMFVLVLVAKLTKKRRRK